jgi:hypothetical protein
MWAAVCCLAAISLDRPLLAQRDSIPPDYPQSLERDRNVLLASLSQDGPSAALFTQLAEVYLNIADDLFTDDKKRLAAYEEGARLARKAFELQDVNAEAHFLYAANLGHVARLQGTSAAALLVREIKAHVARAIEIRPDHAPSLQMMGGLLAELPWFLGGDVRAAEDYLKRAIAVDGDYTNARLLLAKLLIKQDRLEQASQQLRAVIQADHPHYPYTWERLFKPEAERLLQSLKSR